MRPIKPFVLPKCLVPVAVCGALAVWVLGCDSGSKGRDTGGERLGGEEITALFSGKTVAGHHDIHGYDFRSYYEPAGTFRSYQGGASKPREAKWWVKGDKICVHWEDETPPGDLCRHMKTDGKGKYWKVKTTRNKGEILTVSFKSFTDGNPGGL